MKKTTIELPDELADEARRCAAQWGTTMRSLIEEALRREIERRSATQTWTPQADLVFTGKSLPPHEGGQTPVEAAVLGKPVLHGPRMTNFREIIRTLTEAGAVRKVETPQELIAMAVELLQDAAQREQLAAAARAWHEANRGATERTLAVLRAHMAARSL